MEDATQHDITGIPIGQTLIIDMAPCNQWRYLASHGFIGMSKQYAVATLAHVFDGRGRMDAPDSGVTALVVLRSPSHPLFMWSMAIPSDVLKYGPLSVEEGNDWYGFTLAAGSDLRVPIMSDMLLDKMEAMKLFGVIQIQSAPDVIANAARYLSINARLTAEPIFETVQ